MASIQAAVPPATDTNGLLLRPDDLADELRYAHTPDGLLETATVRDGGCVLNGLTFAYDDARRLESATQSVPGLADRTVDYGWEAAAEDGQLRLSAVTYPLPAPTVVNLGYGTAGSLDDRLSRLAALRRGGDAVATYRYMGVGRRVGTVLGNGVRQDFDDGAGGVLAGLDRFGRVRRLEWSNPGLLLGYEYGYDLAGNRKFARVANWPVEDQDWRYQYDGLDRLRTALRGTLDGDNWSFKEPFVPEATQWALDELGNWSGDGQERRSVLTFRDADQDGEWDSPETFLGGRHHGVNQANEIEELITTDGVSPAVAEDFVYDAAGNLVFDGERFYRYDAWNRLAAVHLAGTLEVQPDGTLTGSPGKRVYRYEYDALGRRVQTVRWMYRGDQVTRHVYGSGAAILAEYDVTSNGVVGYDETPARWFVHGEGFPDPVMEVSETGGPPQYLYYLKDALGSVGALADTNGAVVERYTYTPYGQTSVYAANGAPRQSSAFANPFAFTAQRYEPVTGLHHFWARSYDPRLGRWLQRDPLGVLTTGGGVPAAGAEGEPPSVVALGQQAATEYTDALNLYLYVQSRPTALTDALGQFSYAELGGTMAVQGILGGLISGAISSAMGNGFWDAAIGGAIGGAAGGLGGFLANSAFSASAAGFFGTLITHGVVGGVDGAVGGFAQSYYSNRDMNAAFVDSLWGFAVGAASGGMVDLGGKYLRPLCAKLSYTQKRLQHMFNASGAGNHAIDFGVSGNWSKANGELLQEAIEAHVQRSMAIPGTYRGTMKGWHYYDSATQLWVFQTAGGEFQVGWRLSQKQAEALWRSGNVQ